MAKLKCKHILMFKWLYHIKWDSLNHTEQALLKSISDTSVNDSIDDYTEIQISSLEKCYKSHREDTKTFIALLNEATNTTPAN